MTKISTKRQPGAAVKLTAATLGKKTGPLMAGCCTQGCCS